MKEFLNRVYYALILIDDISNNIFEKRILNIYIDYKK